MYHLTTLDILTEGQGHYSAYRRDFRKILINKFRAPALPFPGPVRGGEPGHSEMNLVMSAPLPLHYLWKHTRIPIGACADVCRVELGKLLHWLAVTMWVYMNKYGGIAKAVSS